MKFILCVVFVVFSALVASSVALKSPECGEQPSVAGTCKAFIPSWSFDPAKKCVSFVYGGCGGNKNQFATKELCEKACV